MPRSPRAMTPSWQKGPALVTILAGISTMTAVLQTMVVPVLSKISADLEVSTVAVGWVVTINLLAAAVLTPILSRAGDLHGRRRVALWVIIAVIGGSLLAAVTTSFALLLVARVIQGATFCLLPLSIGILRENLETRRLPMGLSIITGAISVGAGAGLVTTGLLTHGDRDFRNIFWFVLGFCIVLFLCFALVVPRDRGESTGRIDWWGGLTLGLALVQLLLAVTQGNDWGWTSPATVGCFAGSVLTFIAWLWIEGRVREPLVPMPMLRNRTLASANILSFFIGFGMFLIFMALTSLVQVPVELGHGFSASVLETSIVFMLPAAAIGIVASPVGGLAVGRVGARATLLLSSIIGLFGYLQLFLWHSQAWHIILGGVITNGAFSVGFAAIPAVVVSVVRSENTAIANAMTSLTRSGGSAVGSALVVALIATHLLDSGYPDRATFQIAFGVGAATMVLSIVITMIGIPRRRARPVAAPELVSCDSRSH